jgi:hypothetical protein
LSSVLTTGASAVTLTSAVASPTLSGISTFVTAPTSTITSAAPLPKPGAVVSIRYLPAEDL